MCYAVEVCGKEGRGRTFGGFWRGVYLGGGMGKAHHLRAATGGRGIGGDFGGLGVFGWGGRGGLFSVRLGGVEGSVSCGLSCHCTSHSIIVAEVQGDVPS